jgi:hypothetical protein
MVEKTKEICVISTFASCITCTCSFDLWMSHVSFDTFAIIMSFINTSWGPCHVTIGIFEVHNTIGTIMANQVISLLDSFGLLDKIIAYVKDESSNFFFKNFALTFFVFCFALQLTCPFIGSCFGHAMSKAPNMLLMTLRFVLVFQKLA